MASLFTNIKNPDTNNRTKNLKKILNTPEVINQLVSNKVLDLNNEDLNKVTDNRYYGKWILKEYIKFKNQFILSYNQNSFVYNGTNLDLKCVRESLYNSGLLSGSVKSARLKFILGNGREAGLFYYFNFCNNNNKKLNNISIINNLNCDNVLYLPNSLEKITGLEYISTIKNTHADNGVLLVSFGSPTDITINNKNGFNEYRYRFIDDMVSNHHSVTYTDLKLLIKQIKLLRSGITKTCTPKKIYLRCWLNNNSSEKSKRMEMYDWCLFFREKFELKGITGIEFKGNPKTYNFIDFVI